VTNTPSQIDLAHRDARRAWADILLQLRPPRQLQRDHDRCQTEADYIELYTWSASIVGCVPCQRAFARAPGAHCAIHQPPSRVLPAIVTFPPAPTYDHEPVSDAGPKDEDVTVPDRPVVLERRKTQWEIAWSESRRKRPESNRRKLSKGNRGAFLAWKARIFRPSPPSVPGATCDACPLDDDVYRAVKSVAPTDLVDVTPDILRRIKANTELLATWEASVETWFRRYDWLLDRWHRWGIIDWERAVRYFTRAHRSEMDAAWKRYDEVSR
jgi:hypothetical protein